MHNPDNTAVHKLHNIKMIFMFDEIKFEDVCRQGNIRNAKYILSPVKDSHLCAVEQTFGYFTHVFCATCTKGHLDILRWLKRVVPTIDHVCWGSGTYAL